MRSQDDRLLHDFVGRALVYHGGRQRRHLVGHARDQVLRDGLPRFADKHSHRYRRFFHIFCSPLQVANISRARGVGTNRRDDDERCANSGGGFKDAFKRRVDVQ